jgi:hypothetical protein
MWAVKTAKVLLSAAPAVFARSAAERLVHPEFSAAVEQNAPAAAVPVSIER